MTCAFLCNSASGEGGAVCIKDNATPTLNDCTFMSNLAPNGGGISNYESHPNVIACVFTQNDATGYGGAMRNLRSRANVVGCRFELNAAFAGAGMFNLSGSPLIEHCTFYGNWGYYGAGLANYDASSPIIATCAFDTNSAACDGAGIYNMDGSNPEITGCAFYSNVSTWGGGAISNSSSHPTVSTSTFSKNRAKYGAGIHNAHGSSATVALCTFTWNLGESGAGLHNQWGCNLSVASCVFAYNVGISSSAMANTGHAQLVNCTINNNVGSAIYSWGGDSDTLIINCIMSDNTLEDIRGEAGATLIVRYSYVKGGWPGEGNISAKPQFLWDADGVLRLSELSPCVNAGDPSGDYAAQTDFDGEPRVMNGRVDIGADELYFDNDCNGNGAPDERDVFDGTSEDCQGDGVPDECQLAGNDCDDDGVPDECEQDCNGNHVPDDCDITGGTSRDCQGDGVPDECQLANNDCDGNGVPDECDPDIDNDGLNDACETALSIECPGTLRVEAESEDGAAVTFDLPVVAGGVGSVAVAADAASGSVFPVGTTTVTVVATDQAGNAALCTFEIVVAPPVTGDDQSGQDIPPTSLDEDEVNREALERAVGLFYGVPLCPFTAMSLTLLSVLGLVLSRPAARPKRPWGG